MPTDAALLAAVPIFNELEDHERADLAEVLAVCHFPAGEVVFNFGDPGDSLYIIRSGTAEVFITNSTGERIVLEQPGPGAVFGEISLLDQGPRTASVLATRDLEALRLDRENLKRFLDTHPPAVLSLLTAMGRRLRWSGARLRYTATRNVNEEVKDKRTTVQKVAEGIAAFAGSIPFLFIHTVWFGAWITANVVTGSRAFDPFPFGLLTLIVSLEAIFLSVFVLLSQNLQAAKDRVRGDIEYDVNLKAEMEIGQLHEKVDQMRSEILGHLSGLDRSPPLDERLDRV
jgi:CRP/FNR family transcriptional regulator, cyclic AMP receptor protein